MILYHGTREGALHAALIDGITPRGSGDGNWKHTVGSNKETVYLTSAYPLYFAMHAAKDAQRGALIEIDTDALDEGLLIADEDAVEQTTRGRDGLPDNWSLKRRTAYYRARAHRYKWQDSLRALGTCGYRGTIPPEAIRRVLLLDQDEMVRLTFEAADPVISVKNYMFVGEQHEAFTRWLFDRDGECPSNPNCRAPSSTAILMSAEAA